ncbi:D-3-phosphoglycerate dehydrogenase [Fulvivirga imtechensis AK7]|uniref:D-3-phosphoglycerate dehydrogenase n=2 Tax=Fulvivirga TaxID=396811 RepID=L8JL65_9BACT|nr:D-3-phosphoglycerate dehydrogenase [Fulvivirga imtechensis AK7]
MHNDIELLLSDAGFEADYRPDISREEIKHLIARYEGLIIRSKTKVDAELLRQAGRLRFVARAGAGIDNLDVDALNQRGIKIINAPEGNRNAVGEHCVAMLLALLNNVAKADKEVRRGVWDREGNRGYELQGKTVGLLGYGHMGQAFAQKLGSFACKVLAYDKYKRDYTDGHAQEASMEEIYESADIFSIHVPLTAETRSMVGGAYMKRFKKNVFLINTARGEILPLKDICEAIASGKILGAALDVLENEKLNSLTVEQQKYFEFLVNSDKTILTPHVAGWSFESYEKINRVLVDKIINEFNGIE